MSMYLIDSKTLFLHVPRTGGTTIERNIKKQTTQTEKWNSVGTPHYGRKHNLLGHYSGLRLARVRYIFCFVRHPVSYYESVWRWIKKQKAVGRHIGFRTNRWQVTNDVVKHYDADFPTWVERMLDLFPCWVTRLFEQYVGPDLGEFCHYVGRMETLIDDFCKVMALRGHKIDRRLITRKYFNASRTSVAPKVKWPDTLLGEVIRDERVAIERFYGEDTLCRRIYRPLERRQWV